MIFDIFVKIYTILQKFHQNPQNHDFWTFIGGHAHMGTSSFKLRAIPQKYGKIMKFMIIGAAVEFPGAVFPMPMDF